MKTSKAKTETAAFKSQAKQLGFKSLNNARTMPANVTGAFFWGNMWDNPRPGEFMRYWSWIENNSASIRTQVTITAFVGPGCLFADATEGIVARDTGWPMLSSRMFEVKPGDRVRVEMGHRLPAVMPPGVYVLNLLLWESNNYNQQAKLWDRMHLRFEVKA